MRILIKSVRPEVINGKFRAVATAADGRRLVQIWDFHSFVTCDRFCKAVEGVGDTDPKYWYEVPHEVPTAPTEFKTREEAELALSDPETQKVYPTWRTVYMVATREEYEAHIVENVERAIEPKGDENDDNN